MRRKIFLAVLSFLYGFVLFAQAQERNSNMEMTTRDFWTTGTLRIGPRDCFRLAKTWVIAPAPAGSVVLLVDDASVIPRGHFLELYEVGSETPLDGFDALMIQPPYQIMLNKPLPRDITIGTEVEVMPPVDPRGAIQFCGKGEAFLRGYREGREVWRKELYRKGKGYRQRERYVVE